MIYFKELLLLIFYFHRFTSSLPFTVCSYYGTSKMFIKSVFCDFELSYWPFYKFNLTFSIIINYIDINYNKV